MTGIRRMFVLAIGLAVASVGSAVASQQRPYRVNDQQLRDLATRIETHRDTFHESLGRAIDRSPINGSQAEDQFDRAVESFKQATKVLRDRVNDRQSNAADAENVLRRASVIDELMMRNRFDTPAQTDWQALRRDMDELARAYAITWNWSAASQNMPSRVDDKQVQQLLKGIGEKAGRFDKSLGGLFDSGRIDDPRARDEIRQSVADFRQAADRLRDRVNGRQSNTLDVEEVLRRGVSIDGFMQRYQLSTQAEQNWLSLRRDLDTLARAYNVAWNWSNPEYATAAGAGFYHRLTGTYQLENNRGDDPRQVAERAAGAAPSDKREATYQRLLTRLEAPEQLAIERTGNSVTMASTQGQRVTFEADGRDHAEQWSVGRPISTRATFEGERLVVATTGHRGSDYTATFDPLGDGRSLQMTRTIDDEGLRQPVTIRSSYRRLSDEARWSIYTSGGRGPYDNANSLADDRVVPDGTRFVAVLDNGLDAASAHAGDFYTLTARSPAQYEGAVLEGFVSTVDESGRLGGRAAMSLDLRSIRLRDGRSYPFDGVIEGIRTPDGDTVGVDREGTIDATSGNRTRKAAERGAIGAAVGAVIGAVAGGSKGAAIGAVIGAGGGAGTVFIEGRDRLDLPRGTEFTITSGDSRNQRLTPSASR
jgi:hypothetical protein